MPSWCTIPNEHICRCPKGQRTNPNNVAEPVNGNYCFHKRHTFGLNKTSQRMLPIEAAGMLSI